MVVNELINSHQGISEMENPEIFHTTLEFLEKNYEGFLEVFIIYKKIHVQNQQQQHQNKVHGYWSRVFTVDWNRYLSEGISELLASN